MKRCKLAVCPNFLKISKNKPRHTPLLPSTLSYTSEDVFVYNKNNANNGVHSFLPQFSFTYIYHRHFLPNWKQNKYTKKKMCRSGISPIWHFIKRFALFWMNMKEVISAGTKSARKVLLNLTHCLDKHVIWCLRWLSFSLTNYILFSRC